MSLIEALLSYWFPTKYPIIMVIHISAPSRKCNFRTGHEHVLVKSQPNWGSMSLKPAVKLVLKD